MLSTNKRHKIIDWCRQNLDGYSTIKGGKEIVARCPICGDSQKSAKKKRLHINIEENGFHCFNCNESGTIQHLVTKVMNCSYEEAREIVGYKRKLEDVKYELFPVISDQKKNREKAVETIYDDIVRRTCIKISDTVQKDGLYKRSVYKKALKFLDSRKLDSIAYDYFVCYTGRYKNRIIIPVYNENGNIIYFQGRSLGKEEPKYLNPSTPKEIVILNKHRIDPRKPIIVTEGLIDALSLNYRNVTTILGASISQEFINEIQSLTNRKVIIYLDNDKAGYENVQKFIQENGWMDSVEYFIPVAFEEINKYKDINELVINGYDPKELVELVLNSSKRAIEAGLYIKLMNKEIVRL